MSHKELNKGKIYISIWDKINIKYEIIMLVIFDDKESEVLP